ncbi:toll/interleukin-1 receptor domain-containing protein [Qipengyuania sp. ASV99]|uniref:toll/interleukin-1 receptor domain-containing protein n=1 Tax=Qipengyuania sp. ASV99 TaxID=3399681 RepID=UPI003A4C6BBE
MRVFISYRRSDSKDVAARIADNLASVREIDSVFLDVDSIAHGENFPQRLDTEITRADVFIAVIGPGWLGAVGENGQRRIWSDGDFVRREISRALAADKRIIPCLVDDAQMPGPQDIPDDIAALAEKNACAVRHTTFRSDFEILCEAVLKRRRSANQTPLATALGAAWRAGAGLALAAIVAIAIASFGMSSRGVPLETMLGGRVQLALFLLLLVGIFQISTYRYLRRYG